MDRNTILGLLLMGLVIVGFSMLNNDPSTQEQQTTETAREGEAAAAVTTSDSLAADELSRIATIVKQYGNAAAGDNGGRVYTLDSGDAAFAVDEAGALTGTVAMEGGAEYTLADLSEPATGDDRLLRTAAMKKVRDAAETAAKYTSFARFVSGENQTLKLENNLLSLDLSTKGGMIAQATLKQYDAYQNGKNGKCVLFSAGNNAYGFAINTDTHRFNTQDFYFTPVQENDSTVLMKLDFGKGVYFGIRYTLPADSYVARMEVVQQNMSAVINANVATMDFAWSQKMMRHEKGHSFEERNSGVYYKFSGDDGDVDNLSETSDDEDKTTNHLKWIGFKYQFFSCVFIADTHFIGASPMTSEVIDKDSPDNANFMKNVSVNSSVAYSLSNPTPAAFNIFLGPNQYKLLASYDEQLSPNEDLKLTRLIPLGWTFFRWINTGIIIPVFNFLGTLNLNYGIIILLLTLFIKIILFPLTYKSYSSQAKMRVLAPDIKAINDEYPGNENAMKRQQKTMALYNSAGANPMSGCLPLLLQMPILVAMFSFFPSCIDLRGQAFLWAPDLSAPDMILEWEANIPIINWIFGHHLSLFCLLMTAVNVVYTYLNMQANQSSTMPAMKWMMYLMPLMFLVFFNEYAAGLSYYYLLSLLITIIQTYVFRACTDEDKVRAKMAENAKKPRKKSGFMARLEAAQRQQEAMLREQQRRKGKR